MFKFFKKQPQVKKGQIGIYKDTIIFDTVNDSNRTLKYTFFAKVKAIGVFEDIVEIEVVDLSAGNSGNEEILDIIKDNIPHFLDPKLIKWEIKEETINPQENQSS